MDLMFYENKYKNAKSKGFLNIININTRKAYSYPIKSKTSNEILSKLNMFMNDLKEQDFEIYSMSFDEGNEFTNK